MVTVMLGSSPWLTAVLGIAIAYLCIVVLHVLTVAVWSRWFMRRADCALIEVLGREQVVEALRWFSECPGQTGVRWLWCGAPMTARERLRLV